MNNRKLYQSTFSQVHSFTEIRWEDFQTMRRTKRSAKRFLMLAAVVCVLAALSAAAVATGFFGLREALLPEKGSVYATDGNGIVIPGEYEQKDFVSLSGYQDTPESKALAEWQAFLEDYDKDGSIISAIGNDPTGFEDRYGLYLVYTQEMADRLEEIVEKYHLRLHSRIEDVFPETWPVAVGDFFEEHVTPYSGYIYEDGTFRFDGDAVFEDYGRIDYQFSRSVRGTFNDVALNIGNVEDFQEWDYQTAKGTSVTLGLGRRNRSILIADLGDSFVLVNVLTGEEGDDTFSSGPIGRAELEALADSFDFSALAPVRTPDLDAILDANTRCIEGPESRPSEEIPEESEDQLYIQTGMRTETARDFVLMLAERIEDGRKEEVANLLVYPAQVEVAAGTFTVNSPEEFLPYYDEVIGQNRLALSTAMTWEPNPSESQIFRDGSGLAAAAEGAVWVGLVEESVIRVFTIQTDQAAVRAWDGTITQDAGEDVYTSVSTDEGRDFALNLAGLIEEGNREEIAELLTYPVQVKIPRGEWIVNTPEEFWEYYDETLGTGGGTLAADLRADPEPFLDGRGDLASAGSGAVWFRRSEDGDLRILTLQSDVWLWSVRYWGEQP